jgi:trimethylamine:corrinoid methyltransferase-like protein
MIVNSMPRDCFYRRLLPSTDNFERWNRLGARDATHRACEIWHGRSKATRSPRSTPRSARNLLRTSRGVARSSGTESPDR